ncbi:glutathione S-transferase family protein [uncultured Sulfitobacter sp.]|uniref:glutathione S-transferase family protein n=1 Tax=uncultured Sulfitobacter sp. TaxID=191468 RepID=UPI0026321C12|nr:glutathione S-transferase family protein [uncultured Sulfitobacter sp.]
MITLYTFASGFGEFSYSPFCTKAGYLLKMSGTPWERKDLHDPRKMPHGKLPAIALDDGTIVPDSDNIRAHLEGLGHDFDAGLTSRDRGISRAFIRMAEEHMYWHQVHDRWGDEANWAIIRKEYFDFLPALIRGFVTSKLRKDLIKTMHGLGLGRLTGPERLERIEPDLQAIAAQLGEQDFLFGDTPTAADASVGAILGGIIGAPAPTPLSQRVADDRVLSAYIARCREAMG